MSIINIFDYLLLPIYLFFFWLIMTGRARKQPDPQLRKFYRISFWLHMFGSILFGGIVQYYYHGGDAFTYYLGGEFLRTARTEAGFGPHIFFMHGKDLFDLASGYDLNEIVHYGLLTPSTLIMEKISGLLSYLSFHSFLAIGLFMGMFAFLGQWRLFVLLNDILKGKYPRLLGWAVLFIPSVWFWGSGLGKDSLCMGALGYLVYGTAQIFMKRRFNLRILFTIAIGAFLLFSIKSYIGYTFLVGMLFAAVTGFVSRRKSFIARFTISSFLLVIFALAFNFFILGFLQDLIKKSADTIEVSIESYAGASNEDPRSKGSFEASDLDISLGGFIAAAPGKLFSTLFRPFLWEARKPIMLFSALESFAMLLVSLLLLWKTAFFRFFSIALSDPAASFSLAFSVVLALMVGFTTYNFGTLVRYRIPLLPFFGFLLVFIYGRVKERQLLALKQKRVTSQIKVPAV